jgi:hypothetical protein
VKKGEKKMREVREERGKGRREGRRGERLIIP